MQWHHFCVYFIFLIIVLMFLLSLACWLFCCCFCFSLVLPSTCFPYQVRSRYTDRVLVLATLVATFSSPSRLLPPHHPLFSLLPGHSLSETYISQSSPDHDLGLFFRWPTPVLWSPPDPPMDPPEQAAGSVSDADASKPSAPLHQRLKEYVLLMYGNGNENVNGVHHSNKGKNPMAVKKGKLSNLSMTFVHPNVL